MLSRVAENIYWMARYIERAENTARLIMVNTNLLLDLPKGEHPGWQPIVEILGDEETYLQEHKDFEEHTVLKYLIAESNSPISILHCLQLARENARTIRDIIPREGWEQINDIYLMAKNDAESGYTKKGRYDYLREIISGAQTMTGLFAGTMLHDIGYDFMRMGRNLERADMTTRIIDVRSASLIPNHEGPTPFENIQWMSVLKSLTAYQMYRRTIQVRVNRPDVLKFLLKDKKFPRSFYHSILEVKHCLKNLPRNEELIAVLNEVGKKALRADQAVLKQEELHRFIDELQLGLDNLNQGITRNYFQ